NAHIYADSADNCLTLFASTLKFLDVGRKLERSSLARTILDLDAALRYLRKLPTRGREPEAHQPGCRCMDRDKPGAGHRTDARSSRRGWRPKRHRHPVQVELLTGLSLVLLVSSTMAEKKPRS